MSEIDEAVGRPEQFLAMIRRQQRGRLKVYLGFAPGVGKTYGMLQEAHRLKAQGVDVVVGVVETHGRAETAALLDGLELVPRRKISYRGITLEEMDVDAVLARKPTVVLVDELAHTNAPGGKHAKRYEDVDDLLRAGVNVLSTLNVQHLESLYDVVERFTGTRQKERVPDSVLQQADQVVNVDLSAEDLQERLRVGKVYPADRAARALEGYFTGENLEQLRELALEHLAHILDRRRQERQVGNSEPSGSERVMVCVSSRSPNASRLLRAGARLADRLGAPWYAVYVQTPGEQTEKIDAATQRSVADTLNQARLANGVPMQFRGKDVATAVAGFVREYGITHVVVGRSQQPWWKTWFRTSLLDRIVRSVPEATVVVVGET
ncbi:universal stress protein [Paludisphaera rhizosphaerae]|uniref:universal stress protein n=1 Tax=Paludisphaera rhizosphaerae TaxID=2711216 RepID=UPI0013EB17DD|nr:universal stress protein [Paludisphaera rhizosphaerae]